MIPIRLLVVEDTPDDAELMVLRLTQEGFRCDWRRVEDQAGFLAALDPLPDLILADWSLPQFSGLHALQLARSKGMDIPLILVSGNIGEEAAVDALRQGAFDYVLKSHLGRLPQSVRHALEDKRLRDESHRNHEALLQLTRAVEQSPASVVITGLDGAIEYVNPKFCEASGYTLEEVRGKNPRILKSGETPAEQYQELWRTITAGGEWRGEFHNRRKDGMLYWERASISPLRDSNGAITHFLAVKEDITNQKSLELQLLQAQKMESVGLLAGGVAHDFNNLLTVINGYSDLLLRKMPEGDGLRPSIAEIREAGEHAARLTQQLLAFSRKQIVEPKAVDVNALVEGNADLLRRIIGEDIELVTHLAPEPEVVMADFGQLHQVLMNLATNARDAMPGGGTLTIETASADLEPGDTISHPGAAPAPHVVMTVSDTGVGMDAKTQAHIFEPFFTTKGAGMGTGLGLSTVYGIIQQCGGAISVSSEPGRGAAFQIRLPRLTSPIPSDATEMPLPLTLRGSETILLVEDQESVRKLAVSVLEAHGYRVLQASAGPQALRLAVEWHGPIQAVLTDVIMPGMNGRELVDRLKSIRPLIKSLYMSGHSQGVIAQHGMLDSGVSFIAKPFSPDALVLKVRQVLGPPEELPIPVSVLLADDSEIVRKVFGEILREAGCLVVEAATVGEMRDRLNESLVDVALIDLGMPGRSHWGSVREMLGRHTGLKTVLISAAFDSAPVDGKSMGVDVMLGKPIEAELLVETVRNLARGQLTCR